MNKNTNKCSKCQSVPAIEYRIEIGKFTNIDGERQNHGHRYLILCKNCLQKQKNKNPNYKFEEYKT